MLCEEDDTEEVVGEEAGEEEAGTSPFCIRPADVARHARVSRSPQLVGGMCVLTLVAAVSNSIGDEVELFIFLFCVFILVVGVSIVNSVHDYLEGNKEEGYTLRKISL